MSVKEMGALPPASSLPPLGLISLCENGTQMSTGALNVRSECLEPAQTFLGDTFFLQLI